jgi:hypothetical protein
VRYCIDRVAKNLFTVFIGRIWTHDGQPLQHVCIAGPENHSGSFGDICICQRFHPHFIAAADSQAALALLTSLASTRILKRAIASVRQIVRWRLRAGVKAE